MIDLIHLTDAVHPIKQDDGVVTDCSINTQEPDELADFNFASANVTNKIIMRSVALKDTFQELDMTSEFVQILMSPDAPYFRISTFGNTGESLVHMFYAFSACGFGRKWSNSFFSMIIKTAYFQCLKTN